jgi:hypothetical protein
VPLTFAEPDARRAELVGLAQSTAGRRDSADRGRLATFDDHLPDFNDVPTE